MSERIVVDPITRIEGHLRIEAQMDGDNIAEAYSSGTMVRGIETHPQRAGPARRLGLCTTHLRCLHPGPRHSLHSSGGRCPEL